jgi:hypothetical protein
MESIKEKTGLVTHILENSFPLCKVQLETDLNSIFVWDGVCHGRCHGVHWTKSMLVFVTE